MRIKVQRLSIGTTAAKLVPSEPGRAMQVLIRNAGSADIYIGPTSAVTTANGHPIGPSESFGLSIETADAYGGQILPEIWAIAGSAQPASVLEVYVD
ncbi:MAG: hypothetical protein QXZ09_08435 [Candidatus Methanomethylicaceae archaeon]